MEGDPWAPAVRGPGFTLETGSVGATAAATHLRGDSRLPKADPDLSEKGTGCEDSRPGRAMSQAYGGITA